VTTTFNTLPRPALAGTIADIVGAGLATVKAPARVTVPPPGGGFVTLTSLAPKADPAEIEIEVDASVELATTKAFTVTPAPKSTVVKPSRKLVPVNFTTTSCPRTPVAGDTLARVGTGF
jgi:hypothetical protein